MDVRFYSGNYVGMSTSFEMSYPEMMLKLESVLDHQMWSTQK